MNPISNRKPKIATSTAVAKLERRIRQIYARLAQTYGKQHWWPARSPIEVILGAYLTQNTSWSNVEKAVASLRKANLLSLRRLREVPQEDLAQAVRPSGYYRQKANRIKTFIDLLDTHHRGSLRWMLQASDLKTLREELLGLNGTGPETADSILLYASQFPVFVVDAYAKRILSRHGIISQHAEYEQIRALVERAIGPGAATPISDKNTGHRPSPMSKAKRSKRAQHLNEFHALIVQAGKRHCHKSDPQCASCPLRSYLPKDSRYLE